MLDFADNYQVTLPIGPGEADPKKLAFADDYQVTLPVGPGEADTAPRTRTRGPTFKGSKLGPMGTNYQLS